MSHKSSIGRLAFVSLLVLAFSGCFHPPYNNFKPYRRVYTTTPPATILGSAAVAVAGGAPVLAGAAIGAAVGASVGLYKDSRPMLIKQLRKLDMQYIEYGDTVTIIVPTDRYYVFNNARLNDLCFAGLNTLIKLIKTFHKCCPIYVAGFTDNVGSRHSKKLMSQARAETMVTFLWANGISARRLIAEGYGDKNPVGDNKLIHGSAYNRRIEIQIFKDCSTPQVEPVPIGATK
ncbi:MULTISPECIES: C-OmpA-like family protein CmpA [Legionella]|uniref:Outer membrane protein, OmpA family protein n=1 Tax=Legionella maceachernii TaxID=466 RepID=A0A0W0W6E8_9GAMM|nr:C-OmpA-like family protein CmpA [Legionella maceachernii]KTD27932.1 outer membrane protein, OmpA family protein [Legionella maceachernii]SKA25744.1 Outer membrane protein OmpA [Legionella maceachernii]SUP00034.1 Inner membrane lipoprotein YiaD precursor [Legionella maceachernii]